MSVLAVGLALYGQKLFVDYRKVQQTAVALAVTWYAAGIVLLIVAWWGTYKNKTCVLPAPSGPYRVPSSEYRVQGPPKVLGTRYSVLIRYALVPVAVVLNLYSVSLLRADYYSAVGSFGWLGSLLLLLGAFVGQRIRP